MKLCYSCRHFWISLASGSYSEETPGNDWSMNCSKVHWMFDAYEGNENIFRNCLETAETCPDFEERKNSG